MQKLLTTLFVFIVLLPLSTTSTHAHVPKFQSDAPVVKNGVRCPQFIGCQCPLPVGETVRWVLGNASIRAGHPSRVENG